MGDGDGGREREGDWRKGEGDGGWVMAMEGRGGVRERGVGRKREWYRSRGDGMK